MNADILRGNWHQVKGNLKEKWGKLTDDDISRVEGRTEVLLGALQERYGWARDDAKRSLDEFMKDHR